MSDSYKKTVKGTLGAGMSTLFGGAANYYVLEHKVSSRYHKMGEAQEIIVDYVEIGRDKDCAVRFDESFDTVSRHHAAIVRKDGNWKLVHLSPTNGTFLNGHNVADEWYLQNGDEIQLSVNGPKLGFIIPNAEGKKTSMNLTHRLTLFKEQALRPYRQVILIIAVILLLVIGGGVTYGVYAHRKAEKDRIEMEGKAAELEQQLIEQQQLLIEQNEQLITLTQQLDSTQAAAIKAQADALRAEAQAAKDQKALGRLTKKYDDLQKQVLQMLEEEQQEREHEYEKVDVYIQKQSQQ